MMLDLKPYPTMKDSGVEWLGEVPAHWEVRRLRNAADMRVSNVDKHVKEGEKAVRLCNYVDVYKHEHINQQIGYMQATATPGEIERFRLFAGDVLITKDSETWDDIGIPALVTESADDLISGYHLALLRPFADKLSGSYLLRALQSKGLAYQFHVEAKGVTRYGLSHTGIKSILLPLPSITEQTAIVRYLDYVDRRVRRLTQAKRKLIALLTEQKQAIIHHAVTRGLNPDVPLKDSGIEWLGKMPAHWKVVPLGATMHSIQTGPFGSQLHANEYIAGGVPVINPSHIYDERINPDPTITVNRKKAANLARHILLPGDIVLARRGELGRCALVSKLEEGYLCGTGSLRIRPMTNVFEPAYLVHLLSSQRVRDALNFSSIGTTMNNLNASIVSRLRLPVPPIEEQRKIVELIASSARIIQKSLDSAHHEIELLDEYRTRLIADVVTGKLDVRKAAATLPESDPLAANDISDEVLEGDADADVYHDKVDATPEETEAWAS